MTLLTCAKMLTEKAGLRIVVAISVAAVVIQAFLARVPGWNPEALWVDDLVYGAIIRSDDVWNMLTAPIQVAPGLLLVWRWCLVVFGDPEWSLQLLPFVCGIAAIPVMALVVRRLTQDNSLALVAASVTALNPLVAHYSVFVRQYTLEFLVTALFLLAAAGLSRDGEGIDPRRFRRVALTGAVLPFFAMTSVFASFPIVNLGTAYAMRDWLRSRRPVRSILVSAAAYNLAVLAGYLLLRSRSNERLRNFYPDDFLPLDSLGNAWSFLANNGRRLLEMGMPNWETVGAANPDTVSWPLPFIGLGLAWLLVRPATRFFGLVVASLYAAFLTASALEIYPLGSGRPDMFAFPAAICLFAAGIHLATEWLPRRKLFRLAAAMLVVGIALMRPLHVEYYRVNDVPLIDYLAAHVQPEDELILSASGIFLAAYYGPWPVTVVETEQLSFATAKIGRERTRYLYPGMHEGEVNHYLAESRPRRAWYLAYRSRISEPRIIAAMEARGYRVHRTQETRRGRLYLGLARGSP